MRYASGDLIRRFRERRLISKISQRDLSERSGLTQSHISQIETGSLDPGLSSFLQMIRALDLELVLVPRKLVPAVEAIDGSVEPSGLIASGDLSRAKNLLEDYRRLYGDMETLADLESYIELLRYRPLTIAERNELRNILDMLEDARGARHPERLIKRAISSLKALRNRAMQSQVEAPRPAYSANDEDDDA